MKINIALSAEPDVEKTITLKGSQNAIDRILAFLGMLQYNGAVGHSGTFGLGWDGDGSDKLESTELEPIIALYKAGYEACSSYGCSIEYMGDLGSFYAANFAKDDSGSVKQKLVWTVKEGKLV